MFSGEKPPRWPVTTIPLEDLKRLEKLCFWSEESPEERELAVLMNEVSVCIWLTIKLKLWCFFIIMTNLILEPTFKGFFDRYF